MRYLKYVFLMFWLGISNNALANHVEVLTSLSTGCTDPNVVLTSNSFLCNLFYLQEIVQFF